MIKKIDALSATTLFLVVIVAGVLSLVLVALQTIYHLGKENNTYLRTMVCITSVTPTQRTPEYVKGCYAKAEHENGNTVERYGNGK